MTSLMRMKYMMSAHCQKLSAKSITLKNFEHHTELKIIVENKYAEIHSEGNKRRFSMMKRFSKRADFLKKSLSAKNSESGNKLKAGKAISEMFLGQ